MVDALNRNIQITAADNGYVLTYEGLSRLGEPLKCVEIFSSIEELCEVLVELDSIELTDY